LTRGTVDAATITEPFLAAALDRIRILADCYDAIAPRFTISVWFATADWVKKNPVAARAFAAAMRESNEWADTPANHAASGAILAKHTSISTSLLPKMARSSYGGTFEPAIAQPLLDAAVKYGSLAKRVSASDLLAGR
jgi:NitT/TauT family transport system substrate-binding protein